MTPKKSGMPPMKGMKAMNPFGSTKMMGGMKPTKGFAKGGPTSGDRMAAGRGMAKVKNQKSG